MQAQSPKNRSCVLASSSPYRKILLERLGLGFSIQAPQVDETAHAGESPCDLVARLALDKAMTVARQNPTSIIIGSDQLAECDGIIAGKPGSVEKAVSQLQSFSGREVRFLTALAVVCLETGFEFRDVAETRVGFRSLSLPEIRRYVEMDQPLDCAGSFKSEEAGISLLEYLSADDPTAIVGLPLIRLSEALRDAGLQVP